VELYPIIIKINIMLKNKQQYYEMLQVDAKELGKAVRGAVDGFGETPDGFKCNICMLLVFQPEQCTVCEQIFCKECMTGWIASKGK
jgi:hypothetical protein